MNSTTLQEAVFIMANAMGLNPSRDKEEVIDFVNKYRNLLYNSFERVQLFDDYEQCFSIGTFHQTCHGEACPTYRGFTATLDVAGIMGAWESLKPVTTRSRWYEVHRGKDNPRGGELEIIRVNGVFPTERDMNGNHKLKIYAQSKSDTGKVVHVTAKGADGEVHELSFVLNGDAQVIVNRSVCKVVRVVLPPNLCGGVSLYQEDDTLLSAYPSGISVPEYTRYKVNDNYSCGSNTILIQSSRNYLPVTHDHDVIEIGDRLVIEAAGKYFKYGDNTSDSKERNTARGYLEEMYAHINGIKSRDTGKSKQDSLVPSFRISTRVRNRSLPGYRR